MSRFHFGPFELQFHQEPRIVLLFDEPRTSIQIQKQARKYY